MIRLLRLISTMGTISRAPSETCGLSSPKGRPLSSGVSSERIWPLRSIRYCPFGDTTLLFIDLIIIFNLSRVCGPSSQKGWSLSSEVSSERIWSLKGLGYYLFRVSLWFFPSFMNLWFLTGSNEKLKKINFFPKAV